MSTIKEIRKAVGRSWDGRFTSCFDIGERSHYIQAAPGGYYYLTDSLHGEGT